MDNGWNSEIAVKNVKSIVKTLNLDYESYVLDWNEFREIQLAFLKSSIVDLEMPTDIAIAASLYETANRYGIKYIVSGGNYSGEGILPLTWGYHVLKDEKLYRNIVENFSEIKLKKVPSIGLCGEIYYKFMRGIKTIYPLNLVEYNKDEARNLLKMNLVGKTMEVNTMNLKSRLSGNHMPCLQNIIWITVGPLTHLKLLVAKSQEIEH